MVIRVARHAGHAQLTTDTSTATPNQLATPEISGIHVIGTGSTHGYRRITGGVVVAGVAGTADEPERDVGTGASVTGWK